MFVKQRDYDFVPSRAYNNSLLFFYSDEAIVINSVITALHVNIFQESKIEAVLDQKPRLLME